MTLSGLNTMALFAYADRVCAQHDGDKFGEQKTTCDRTEVTPVDHIVPTTVETPLLCSRSLISETMTEIRGLLINFDIPEQQTLSMEEHFEENFSKMF